MATITSAASGNWSAGGTWVGGVAPTSVDDAVIANTHTITLNATGCVAKSITINSGGTLTNTTAAAWDLTVGNVTGDTANIVLNSGGTLNLDMSAAPTYAGTVYLNKGNNAAGLGIQTNGTSTFSLKGAVRKRHTRLNGAIAAGATSAVVDDASGWRVGDRIIFGTTQPYNATPRIDAVVLTSVSGANIGWTGGITYDHADNGYVGNFSSNLTIRPYGTNRSYVAADNSGTRTVQDVLFDGLGGAVFPKYGLSLNSGNGGTINNNAFYSTHAAQTVLFYVRFLGAPITRQDNVFYTSVGGIFGGQAASIYVGDVERAVVFRSGTGGLSFNNPGEKFIDSVAMACADLSFGAGSGGAPGNKLVGCSLVASNAGLSANAASVGLLELENCQVGTEFGAHNGTMANFAGSMLYKATDCNFQTSGAWVAGLVSAAKPRFIGLELVNKNGDVSSQENYYPHCEIKRSNSETNRATSSISIKPTLTMTDAQRTQQILCAAGSSIRVVGYVKADSAFYNGGGSGWNAPTVTISGNGITPVTFTASAAANNAWEQFDLAATNSSGVDGNFTLTYTANAKSVTTGTVYFDGVPDAPFVTKCRHYGFLFDESSPTRTVDPYASASEATAAAYTGVTISGGTKRITFGAGTADTAQKFYDYSRAWCCLNLAQQVPFTRAGALLALAAGWTVEEPAYSGVTWGGGNIEWNSTGNKSGAFDSCDFTFTAAGTYTFSSATFGGTVELINTSGGSVTVELPSGTSYTNTGPNITVTTPQVYQSVTLTGVVAGSRVQIYDTTNSLELLNSTAATSWTDSSPAAGSRAIRIRVSKVSGATAKEFIEANIGTCGTTAGTAAVAYLVSQSDDDVYNANAIDGSTVTGITFTDAATDLVNIDVASNSVTWPQIYAAFVYWISTATGIADDIAYIEAKDTANYTLTSMQIKNTSSPTEPLVVSGGYGIDSITGTTLPLADATGGTLVFAPDHVVAYQTSGTYAITGDISTVLAAIPSDTENAAAVLAAATAAPIRADVRQVKGQTITGSGTELDPWGP